MTVHQKNIDAAVGLIRQALGPGANGQSLHRALELLTNEEETAPAAAPREGTSFMTNTHQPTTGVDNPDPNAPPFQGTVGGNNNAILAARAADGEAPVNEPEQHELGSADPGAANMNLVGGGAGTAGATDPNLPASGDLSAPAGGAADGSSTFAPQGTTDGSPVPTTQESQEALSSAADANRQPAADQQVAQPGGGAAAAPNQDELNKAVAAGASVGGNEQSTASDGKETDEQASIRTKAAREGILDGNIADVTAAVEASTSVADLKKLRTDEENGKTRTGVISAIDKAIDKLEAE